MSISDKQAIWSDGKRWLYQGDSRELCRLLKPKSFDTMLTDPPYGEGLVAGDESPKESAALLRDVLEACLPALKPAAHVAYFWSSRSVDLAIAAGRDVGLEFRRLLYMYTPQGDARPYRGWLPRVQPVVLMRVTGRDIPAWRDAPAEAIRAAMKSKHLSCNRLGEMLGVSARLVTKWYREDDETWSYPGAEHRNRLSDILGVDLPEPPESESAPHRHDLYTLNGGSSETDHPCEKPRWVIEDMLLRLGGPVLDPFAGSGTALVAARRLGIECVGLEIDLEHCKTAVERLRQSELFT